MNVPCDFVQFNYYGVIVSSLQWYAQKFVSDQWHLTT